MRWCFGILRQQWLPTRKAEKWRTRSRPNCGTAASYLASSLFDAKANYAKKAYDRQNLWSTNKRSVWATDWQADFRSLWIASKCWQRKETFFALRLFGSAQCWIPNMTIWFQIWLVWFNFQPGTFGCQCPSLKVYQTWDKKIIGKRLKFGSTLLFFQWCGLEPFHQFTTPRPHIYKWTQSLAIPTLVEDIPHHNYIVWALCKVLVRLPLKLQQSSATLPTENSWVSINQVRERA